jgi:NAD(P)-dependent dehydrogenase (short-subunit alcohol dehydrogenase family)
VKVMKRLTILITGATSGIGRHAALHLARAGHRVLASGRNDQALRSLKAEASALDLEVLLLDVTDRSSLRSALSEIMRLTEGRGVDALINNAGYGEMAPVLEMREGDVRAMYETNVFGLLAVTQAIVPSMIARGSGRIVNVSSVGGRLTLPLFGAYNSTKYAVESLSDALRVELRPFGIEVVLIEPAAIKTEFMNTSVRKVGSYSRADSPYAAIYARIGEIQRQTARTAAEPIVVSRAIERALSVRVPRPRYVAPFSGRFVVAMATWLPARVLDWILSRLFGLAALRLEQGRATGMRLGSAPD